MLLGLLFNPSHFCYSRLNQESHGRETIEVFHFCHTLNLGYKGHWNLAELVLTLILLTILTSFDPKPDPYFLTLKLS